MSKLRSGLTKEKKDRISFQLKKRILELDWEAGSKVLSSTAAWVNADKLMKKEFEGFNNLETYLEFRYGDIGMP